MIKKNPALLLFICYFLMLVCIVLLASASLFTPSLQIVLKLIVWPSLMGLVWVSWLCLGEVKSGYKPVN